MNVLFIYSNAFEIFYMNFDVMKMKNFNIIFYSVWKE